MGSQEFLDSFLRPEHAARFPLFLPLTLAGAPQMQPVSEKCMNYGKGRKGAMPKRPSGNQPWTRSQSIAYTPSAITIYP